MPRERTMAVVFQKVIVRGTDHAPDNSHVRSGRLTYLNSVAVQLRLALWVEVMLSS